MKFLLLTLWFVTWTALYFASIRVFGNWVGVAAVVLIAVAAPYIWTYKEHDAGER